MLDPAPVFQQCVNWPSVIQQIMHDEERNELRNSHCDNDKFLDQCKKRQRKEKFRGFIPVHLARYKIQTNEQKCLLGFNWEYLR